MQVLGLVMYGIISTLSEVEDCLSIKYLLFSAQSKFFDVGSVLVNGVQKDGLFCSYLHL